MRDEYFRNEILIVVKNWHRIYKYFNLTFGDVSRHVSVVIVTREMASL